jgi:hypothetical protein
MRFLHLARLREIYVHEAEARNLKIDTGLLIRVYSPMTFGYNTYFHIRLDHFITDPSHESTLIVHILCIHDSKC